MTQAATTITTIPADQTIGSALLLQRLVRMADVAPIRHCRTVDPRDIEATQEAIERAHDIFVSHVGRLLRDININLPVTQTIDDAVIDYMAALADLRSDLYGALTRASDRLSDN